MLPGAAIGVKYFIKPVWKELLNVQVWVACNWKVYMLGLLILNW